MTGTVLLQRAVVALELTFEDATACVRSGSAPGWVGGRGGASTVVTGDVTAALAVATASGPGPAVVLWVQEATDTAAAVGGIAVVRDGVTVAAYTWGAGEGQGGGDPEVASVALVTALGTRTEAYVVRAYLRQDGDPLLMVAEVAALLDLDQQLAEILVAGPPDDFELVLGTAAGRQRWWRRQASSR
ncbi:MAG: hypothetical protein ACJ72D_29935 [Marmoricola sp.]